MWKQLLIMALLLAGLIAWDFTMGERTLRQREAAVRIEQFVNIENLFTEERPIAAYRLDRGDGAVHLYIHTAGVWRCLTAHGAVALSDRIDSLLPKLAVAQGSIRTRDPNAAAAYGFDSPDMLTFSICGPEVLNDPTGDVIYAIDIGHSIPATGGSYVRPLGSDAIWEINVDFREELVAPPDSMLPPMIDPTILPAAWPGFQTPGVDRIVIEVPGEPPLELQRYDRGLDEDRIAAGHDPWEWTVKKGDREFVAHGFQMYSYSAFLMQADYVGILSPLAHTAASLGFDQPRGRITLRSAHGPIMQLIIGQRAPRGGVPVLNTFTENIFEVSPYLVDMLLPEMDMLLVEELGNPWDTWRRQR